MNTSHCFYKIHKFSDLTMLDIYFAITRFHLVFNFFTNFDNKNSTFKEDKTSVYCKYV